MPIVSFCSTNYNTAPVTRRALESVARGAEGLDYEIVVVDNQSSDGSYEEIASFEASGPVRVTRLRCSRGIGRQRAFEESRGEIVVTFDLDTLYNETWARLLRWVLANRPPYALSAVLSQFYPRSALERIGGWRDFQYWEDIDLWVRLAEHGLYRTYPAVCGENMKRVPGTNAVEKVRRLHARVRDKVAIADWIPFTLYWQGYLSLLRRTGRPRHAYFLGVMIAAYVAGRAKRGRLCQNGYDPTRLTRPDIPVDLGLVDRGELVRTDSPYHTTEGCRAALARGDLGFLPGTYD